MFTCKIAFIPKPMEEEQFVTLLNEGKILRFRAVINVHTLSKNVRIGEYELSELETGDTSLPIVDRIHASIEEEIGGRVSHKVHPTRIVLTVLNIILK